MNGTTKRNKDKKPIDIVKCNSSYFKSFNQSKVLMYGIRELNCIKDLDLIQLQGDFYSEVFKYLELKLIRCVNKTSKGVPCKSDREIDEWFAQQQISLPLINSYFDYNDFNVIQPTA